MRISSAQAIGRIDKDSLDQPLRSKIAHALEAGTDQARPAIAVVLEYPFWWHLELPFASKGEQRRRLAGDRALLPLLVRRYACIDRCRLHRLLPSPSCRARSGPDQEPGCRKPVRAWQRAADRMQTQDGQFVSPAA